MNAKTYVDSDMGKQWDNIDFIRAYHHVKKLQRRIERAYKNDNHATVKSLQHIMIHSFYARALAVKYVSESRGSKTPGIDGVIWKSSADKMRAVLALKRRGYRPKPLRRIYVKKNSGKTRPIGIPTMKDRAMQTLYRFTLEPIAEINSDRYSYAYRKGKNALQAVACVSNLLNCGAEQWFLKTDIASCFDSINHDWLLKNIPMDKYVLSKILKCGYVGENTFHPSNRGVPQGGCLSSVFANMVLDGIEYALLRYFGNNLAVVRYSDDICVVINATGSMMVVEQGSNPVRKIMTVMGEFLHVRGLRLSMEKTYMRPASKGVIFLGHKISKVNGKPIIEPDNKRVDNLLKKLIHITSEKEMRRMILGWLNYYGRISEPQSIKGVEFDVVMKLYGSSDGNQFVEPAKRVFAILDEL